jgi:type II secretory pathway pseudopilin PulG
MIILRAWLGLKIGGPRNNMNRKNLIELLAAVAVTAAMYGCASVPAPQHTADVRQEAAKEDLGSARNAWEECVRAAIPRLDDAQSTSEIVARTAMKGCSDQYADMVRALTRTLAPTCGQDSDCAHDALAKAQHEATVAATDDVVTARVRVAGAQVLKCE